MFEITPTEWIGYLASLILMISFLKIRGEIKLKLSAIP